MGSDPISRKWGQTFGACIMKPIWAGIAFAAGIAVGVVASRTNERESAPPPVATTPIATNDSAPAIPVPPGVQAAPVPTVPPAPVEFASAKPGPQSDAPAAPLSSTTPATEPVAEYTGYSEPIDVGPAFRKSLAPSPVPGVANQLADAHRALEREARDDGWSYSMEAEIQNAMVNEVSTDAFRAEHVECRATMCEVRLSGEGDQAAAVKRWTEGLGGQPFGLRLFLNHSSSICNNDRVVALLIFRRPP
jgi:hypothetical protein